ncbi:MAG TPA: choice-of-anchor tandem repeat GloVer-containing protein [Methylocella sp.]|nr:choice-of-anchor tandem repeat GloVer-containing protein [Methylocella sp.]
MLQGVRIFQWPKEALNCAFMCSLCFAAIAEAVCIAPAQAAVSVLYQFKSGSDGSTPLASLIIGTDGSLYGTTSAGGSANVGTVFKLTPPGPGRPRWTETVLYRFKGIPDGSTPVSELIFDKAGALYGTTVFGGTAGCGTVFRLKPPAPGQTQWTQSILYSFKGAFAQEGCRSLAGLIFDGAGALYGTNQIAGNFGSGTVFKLTPPAPGKTGWTKQELYHFKGGLDGREPYAGLIAGKTGALYGTTRFGGQASGQGFGTVFRLTPPPPGQKQWKETVLYRFKGGVDGAFPEAGLIFDQSGALYGTTRFGGQASGQGFGTVFKLTPPLPGKTQWTETVLYRFQRGNDGAFPQAGLIFDQSGALYGTTFGGGGLADLGTVFKLSPPPQGQTRWTRTILYRFSQNGQPSRLAAGLVFDKSGALYSTSMTGGPNLSINEGTVFRIK